MEFSTSQTPGGGATNTNTNSTQLLPTNYSFPVITTKRTVIPKLSSIFIPVQVPTTFTDAEATIFTTKFKGPSSVAVPSQLISIQNHHALILVTNFSTSKVVLSKHKQLLNHLVQHSQLSGEEIIPLQNEETSHFTSSLAKLSDDIRVRPEFIQYIEKKLLIDKSQYTELFVNGGNFQHQPWNPIQKGWINPPWQFINSACIKLMSDSPIEWIFVLPNYLKPSLAMKFLSSLDGVEILQLLQSVHAVGYFQRYYKDNLVQDLPYPFGWSTTIIKGSRASTQLSQGNTETARLFKKLLKCRNKVQVPVLPVLSSLLPETPDLPAFFQNLEVGTILQH